MPTITGSWTTLKEDDFDATHPSGGFLHFRPRGVTELDPFTRQDTGKTARELIQDLADVHGWPLIGIFISASGQSTPHLVIHRSEFPSQTGNPEQRAEKLQNDLDAAMENIYKFEHPDEPGIEVRNFWVNTHVFTYRSDGLYAPRIAGVGDYLISISNSSRPGNWWQGL